MGREVRDEAQPQGGLVDRQTDSSALPRSVVQRCMWRRAMLSLGTCSGDLLGVESGTRGCALVGSPPTRSEGVLCQVLG